MALKKKILFLIPSLRGGGAERTLINLLHKINYDRYEIDLVVVSKIGIYIDQIPEEVNVIYLFKNNFLVRILGYLHRTFNIEWVFRNKMSKLEKKYDVGISYLDSNYTDLLFYTDQIKKRVAVVQASYLTHSNYERFYKYEKYRRKIKRDRYSNLDRIYFVSPDSMTDFKELFGDLAKVDMDVLYNMIDKKAVIDKSKYDVRKIDFNLFSFSAVGSLLPIKGFERLIRAAKIVRDKKYQFEIHLAGSGPEEEHLKSLIKEFELEDRVTLHGFLKNPYPMMKSSNVFVMSSVSEGLPTVLCEAMILGVPVLVTNCSGCRGLVEENKYGLIAEQDDKDLAAKMMLLMDDSELLKHYEKKSLERAKLFDDKRILERYYDLFDEI